MKEEPSIKRWSGLLSRLAEPPDGTWAVTVDKPKDPPWAPPYDENEPCPELRCAVTGRVDAADDCTCAGCTAAKVRAR